MKVKTIVLASGKSSRMHPLGDKNLLCLEGEPLIIKLLKRAKQGGLKDFIIVTNKNNDKKIRENLSLFGFTKAKTCIQKNQNLGVAEGVRVGLKQVKNTESVFILGGNDFINPKTYKLLIKQTKKKKARGGILAYKTKKYFPGGYLKFNKKERLQRIIEKPGEKNTPSSYVNIFAHFFLQAKDIKTALAKIPKKLKSGDGIYEKQIDALAKKIPISVFLYDKEWHTVKYPFHVLSLSGFFLSQAKTKISRKAIISKKAPLSGKGIVIKKDVRVLPGATIVGPCYIGENTLVGSNCLVRNANIEKNCDIGFGTEVARSVLSPCVSAHSSYIGDSVISTKVNFGAFSCTTNLRLDHKNIQIKIKNKTLDSGAKKLGSFIGSDAQIGAGVFLSPGKLVNKGDFIYNKFQLKTIKKEKN